MPMEARKSFPAAAAHTTLTRQQSSSTNSASDIVCTILLADSANGDRVVSVEVVVDMEMSGGISIAVECRAIF